MKYEAVDCGNPTTILKEQEGLQESQPLMTIYESKLSIICNDGFIWDDKTENPLTIECLYTGSWSTIPKICTSKHIILLKFEVPRMKIYSFYKLRKANALIGK